MGVSTRPGKVAKERDNGSDLRNHETPSGSRLRAGPRAHDCSLKGEGFGVLTEIDVKETLKRKLDVDFPRYRILGACNPPLAHRALTAEPAIGLLLPCNVVVAERAEGGSTVSAVAPMKMFQVVDNPDLDPVVNEVEAKLRRVLDSL